MLMRFGHHTNASHLEPLFRRSMLEESRSLEKIKNKFMHSARIRRTISEGLRSEWTRGVKKSKTVLQSRTTVVSVPFDGRSLCSPEKTHTLEERYDDNSDPQEDLPDLGEEEDRIQTPKRFRQWFRLRFPRWSKQFVGCKQRTIRHEIQVMDSVKATCFASVAVYPTPRRIGGVKNISSGVAAVPSLLCSIRIPPI